MALIPPPLSRDAEGILAMYQDIARGGDVEFQLLTAWEQRRSVRLSWWQEETIFAIDAVIRRPHSEHQFDNLGAA